MRKSMMGSLVLATFMIAVPFASAGFLPLVTLNANPGATTLVLAPGEMVFVDSTGAVGVMPVPSTDANNDCIHDSLTPGSAISPLENTCTMTDYTNPSAPNWLVGWQYPPNIAGKVPATFVGVTEMLLTGSNGASVTGTCNWEWIPRLGETVSCSFSYNGIPAGNLNADFENKEAAGSWWAILYAA